MPCKFSVDVVAWEGALGVGLVAADFPSFFRTSRRYLLCNFYFPPAVVTLKYSNLTSLRSFDYCEEQATTKAKRARDFCFSYPVKR